MTLLLCGSKKVLTNSNMNSKQASDLAKELPGTTMKDHFGSDAFSANKRTFATIWHDKNEVNLRLRHQKQSHFLETGGDAFEEIDNSWGRQGWIKVYLEYVEKPVFAAALESAWEYSSVKGQKKGHAKGSVK